MAWRCAGITGLLTLLGLVSTSSGEPLTSGDRLWKYRGAIVYIELDPAGGQPREQLGTGFIVRTNGWVLTNNHVACRLTGPPGPAACAAAAAPGARLLGRVGRPTAPEQPLHVIKRDADVDLALLRLPESASATTDEPWNAVTVGDSDSVHTGAKVVILGFPKGVNEVDRNEGTIRRTNAERGMFATQAPTNPGNSGGPAFEGANVVAVVHGGKDSQQNMNFLIPINYARPLLLIIKGSSP
jgi:S1-C subfamily serine protease